MSDKKERKNRKSIVKPIEKRHVYSHWNENQVDYKKSFVWNLFNQIRFHCLVQKSEEQLNSIHLESPAYRRIDFDSSLIAEMLIKFIDVAVDLSSEDHISVYMTDVDNPDLMTDSFENVQKIVAQLLYHNNKQSIVNRKRQLRIDDITREVISYLSTSDEIGEVNLLPMSYISTNVGVYDVRNKRYLTNKETIQYDLNYQYDWFVMTDDMYQDLSDNDKALYQTAKESFNRGFLNWSFKDADLKNLDSEKMYTLKQVMLKSVLGYGSGQLILFQGEGGNGKSTFMDCIESLIGSKYTVKMNLHDLSDDNKIAMIQSNTKVILGKDSATNTHLKYQTLSIFKSLLQGEEILVNEKYKKPRYVTFTGPYIQATNTDIAFHENSDAMRDRIIKLTMAPINFRHRDDKIDFKKILSTKMGKTALITMLIEDVSDIDKFNITEEMRLAVDEAINDADTLTHFIEDIKYKFYGIRYIADDFLYAEYTNWHKLNMSGNRLSSTNFKKNILPVMKKIGYKAVLDKNGYRDRRNFNANRFKEDDYYSHLHQLVPDTPERLQKSTYYEFVDKCISNEDLDRVRMLISDHQQFEFENDIDQTVYNLLYATEHFIKSMEIVSYRPNVDEQ